MLVLVILCPENYRNKNEAHNSTLIFTVINFSKANRQKLIMNEDFIQDDCIVSLLVNAIFEFQTLSVLLTEELCLNHFVLKWRLDLCTEHLLMS